MGVIDSSLWTERARVLVAGLDAAGKTSIIYRYMERTAPKPPSLHHHADRLSAHGLEIEFVELNNSFHLRDFSTLVDAVVYVIDSADINRLEISQEAFTALLSCSSFQVNTPVAILANKQDISGCLTVQKIAELFHISELREKRMCVMGVSAMSNTGLSDALRWVCNAIHRTRQE